MRDEVDLTRPCDACGRFIGGGSYNCPKCKIYLCHLCSLQIILRQTVFPVKCPMCREELQ